MWIMISEKRGGERGIFLFFKGGSRRITGGFVILHRLHIP
ncbi:MAG: hypothetical protein JETT_1829 [Candidatus Jettenia ecosi]|uniref:Uncharacterized protein n=1 Tax=Candidatus Jettenia ecosi TaxID=2494326 RepID=A0A533QAZ8_9BACT|nr:MAG: hypothetical protein JETT_1829 [Candidatus Jettenia ecosi]